jgi:hypothetical protein
VNRRTDPGIGAAAAQVARKRVVNVGVCRQARLSRFAALQKSGGLHDLARLTVATLRNLMQKPRLLNSMKRIAVAQALNRQDGKTFGIGGCDLTGANSLSGQMHGAGPALGHAAPVFRAKDPQLVAQDPQKRHLGFDIHLMIGPVHGQFHRLRHLAVMVYPCLGRLRLRFQNRFA